VKEDSAVPAEPIVQGFDLIAPAALPSMMIQGVILVSSVAATVSNMCCDRGAINFFYIKGSEVSKLATDLTAVHAEVAFQAHGNSAGATWTHVVIQADGAASVEFLQKPLYSSFSFYFFSIIARFTKTSTCQTFTVVNEHAELTPYVCMCL